jgi:hypothetical protein
MTKPKDAAGDPVVAVLVVCLLFGLLGLGLCGEYFDILTVEDDGFVLQDRYWRWDTAGEEIRFAGGVSVGGT